MKPRKFIEATWQVSLNRDESGIIRAYVLVLDDNGQWSWLADAEFGPFDTSGDVLHWALKRMLKGDARLVS